MIGTVVLSPMMVVVRPMPLFIPMTMGSAFANHVARFIEQEDMMSMMVFESFMMAIPIPSSDVIFMMSAATPRVHRGAGQDECPDGEGGRKRCHRFVW